MSTCHRTIATGSTTKKTSIFDLRDCVAEPYPNQDEAREVQDQEFKHQASIDMPAELVKRIDLDKLYPPFVEALLELLAACRAAGTDYYADTGFRTFAEQMKLWAQGRTQPGLRVTNANAGFSCHNYGIAVDLMHDSDLAKPGVQPDWDPKNYQLLAALGPKYGLQVNVRGLADYGHVQWPLEGVKGRSELGHLISLKQAFDAKGLSEAWKYLDSLRASTPAVEEFKSP